MIDPLPQHFRPDFDRLANPPHDEIPSRRRGRNILVAAWNLCELGDPTVKWRSRKRDKPLGHEGSGGNSAFDHCMRRMERVPLSYRISDRCPLWVAFLVPRRSGS